MSEKELPYQNKGDLTKGPVRNHLIRLTIPMIWGMMAIISLQLADTYFISMLGTRELAGISFTFPVTMAITHIVFGLNIALSSVISRMIGAKNISDTKRIVLHGIILAISASFIIATLAYIFIEPLFMTLGANEKTMPIVMEYMPLWLVGSVFLTIPVNGNSAIRAAGDAFLPAMVMITMALINVILDPILIFGLLGAPALGVKGAAIATLIAYICCMIMGLYILIVKKDLLPRDGLHLDKFKDSVKRLIFIAIPVGLTNIIMPVTNAVIMSLLADYGEKPVAAYGVATRVEAFALLIVISLAVGMAPVVGQNWGAKKYSRVHKTINMAIGFNFVWSFFIAIIMGSFAHQIAGAFSSDPEVIRHATLFFWIVPFSYAFSNLVFGWGSAFNAMGMPKRSFFMIVVKSLVLTIPAVFVGKYLYGITGIFIAMAAVNLVAGLIFHITSWHICLKHEKIGQVA